MSLSIEEFFNWLDEYPQRVPLEELKLKIDALDIDYDDVREFARFSDKRYQRNLWRSGPGYHLDPIMQIYSNVSE